MTRPVIGVIAAAGTGQRLGAELPKAFVELEGQSLLERSVLAMRASRAVNRIVILVHPQWCDYARDLLVKARLLDCPELPVTLVKGGQERADSVWKGLQAIPDQDAVVLIHDAARALTPPGLIARVVHAVVGGSPAVIPVLPVVDTIKQVNEGVVVATPSRSELRAAQTPQGFDLAALRRANHAHFAAEDPGFTPTDDASLMEWFGVPVACVPGDPLAFKITTALDYRLAQTLLDGVNLQSTEVFNA